MKKSIVVSIHIIFWIILIASKLSRIFVFKYLSSSELGSIFMFLGFLVPIYFYIGYWGVMKLIKKKGFILYSSIGKLFSFIILTYLILLFISNKAFAYGMAPISSMIFWAALGCLFKFFIDWFQKRNEIILLDSQNNESKLALLRTQINPHFLFNTLHNIDTLIKDNQEKASKSLIRLSDIMRYMLQETKSEKVLIEKELEHIENYTLLEKLRLKNENFFKLKIEGDYSGVKVSPMLFIPFVENAFKHSVDSEMENGIGINFSFDKNTITFICENHYDASETEKDSTHGIGLKTVKSRLNLIYPEKHKLVIKKGDAIFKVKLEINTYEN